MVQFVKDHTAATAAIAAVVVAAGAVAAIAATRTTGPHPRPAANAGSPTNAPAAAPAGSPATSPTGTPTAAPSAGPLPALTWQVSLAAPAPDARGLDQLAAVTELTCVAPASCVGIGSADQFTRDPERIVRFNGRGWTATARTKNVFTVIEPTLPARAWCTSPSQCIGVTDRLSLPIPGTAVADNQTWITRWDGKNWTKVNVLNGTGSGALVPFLDLVACADAAHCIAISGTVGAPPDVALARLAGSKWQTYATPPPRGVADVTCAAVDDCWAVGPDAGTILHIDATSWRTVDAPTPPGTSSGNGDTPQLGSVACSSPTDCWATGGWYTPETQTTGDLYDRFFLEHYDGHAWTVSHDLDLRTRTGNVDSPTPQVTITCPAPNDCLALQASHEPDGYTLSQWDGHTWQVERLPRLPMRLQQVTLSLTCASASYCVLYGAGLVPGESYVRPLALVGVPSG